MKRVLRYLFTMLTFLVCMNCSLQAQNLTFFGTLPAINLSGSISEKFDYNFFGSTTIDAFNKEIDGIYYPSTDLQLYIQPSLIYKFKKQLNFSFSYTYQRNNPFRTIFVNEHRLWQQAMFTKNLKLGKLTNRIRFEERFIENKVIGNYPLSTRLRYQIGFTMPLKKNGKETNLYYLNTSNEFYFSLSGQKNALFSENWAYFGLGVNLSAKSKFEMGYLFQTLVRNPEKDLRFLNLIQVTWITNFSSPQRKQKK